MNKLYIALGVVAVIAIGAYFYPAATPFVATSTAGTTFSSAKIASQSVTVATDTQMAILNTDASTRTITGVQVLLTGGAATTTLYTIACATSSVATGLSGNTNYVLKESLSIYDGTTTLSGLNFYLASTSPGLMGTSSIGSTVIGTSLSGNVARGWASGSYLVCKSITTSGSNTNLLDSGMTGTITFPYTAQ